VVGPGARVFIVERDRQASVELRDGRHPRASRRPAAGGPRGASVVLSVLWLIARSRSLAGPPVCADRPPSRGLRSTRKQPIGIRPSRTAVRPRTADYPLHSGPSPSLERESDDIAS
jgi:hypothetical protein